MENSEKCLIALRERHTGGEREPLDVMTSYFAQTCCSHLWPPGNWEDRQWMWSKKLGKPRSLMTELSSLIHQPENSFILRLSALWDNTLLLYFNPVESGFLWLQLKERAGDVMVDPWRSQRHSDDEQGKGYSRWREAQRWRLWLLKRIWFTEEIAKQTKNKQKQPQYKWGIAKDEPGVINGV